MKGSGSNTLVPALDTTGTTPASLGFDFFHKHPVDAQSSLGPGDFVTSLDRTCGMTGTVVGVFRGHGAVGLSECCQDQGFPSLPPQI